MRSHSESARALSKLIQARGKVCGETKKLDSRFHGSVKKMQVAGKRHTTLKPHAGYRSGMIKLDAESQSQERCWVLSSLSPLAEPRGPFCKNACDHYVRLNHRFSELCRVSVDVHTAADSGALYTLAATSGGLWTLTPTSGGL